MPPHQTADLPEQGIRSSMVITRNPVDALADGAIPKPGFAKCIGAADPAIKFVFDSKTKNRNYKNGQQYKYPFMNRYCRIDFKAAGGYRDQPSSAS